jgi:hypothetical protein
MTVVVRDDGGLGWMVAMVLSVVGLDEGGGADAWVGCCSFRVTQSLRGHPQRRYLLKIICSL